MEELNFKSIIKTPSGKTILDFGQDFAGWVRIRIHSSTPCEIVLRHAEVLENDELGTRPLRQAQATDTLIIPAGKSILWEPKFTFHGFRYVQIDGWPGNVPTSAVAGIAMYTAFGDRELLARQHDSMTAWIQCITRRSNGLWDYTSDWKLGDWLDPQSPPDDPGDSTTDPVLVSDAFLVHVHQLMGQVCEALGLDDESSRWRAEHARLQQAFHEEYITPAGRLAADTQTARALALCFSLHNTPQQVDKVAERLDYLVRRRSRFRIATGFAGTPYLGHAMTKCGLSDIFYRMLLNRDCPSWLYPVTMGATTMWERWDSMLPSGQVNTGEITSFNHYALGSVSSWMHRNIIGLSPLEPLDVRPGLPHHVIAKAA